jgi:polysaccharide biosynthesis/export protein
MINIVSKTSRTFLFVFILFFIISFSSCIPQKKIKMVQFKDKSDTLEVFTLKQRPKNTVQPFDNLYIRVISPDQQTSNMFNSESHSSTYQNINYNMISYTVNDSGYIDFPFVGQVMLKGLTILEAKDTLQNALSKYISNSTLIVKFVGKSVTVIGEVNSQGEYEIYDDNVNVFTVLAMARGLTDYGDRQRITIIREVAGKATYNYLDLTDRHLLKSDFYYLKPEDVIIVQPLRQKSYGFSSFPYTLVLSGLTTIIALMTYMRSF